MKNRSIRIHLQRLVLLVTAFVFAFTLLPASAGARGYEDLTAEELEKLGIYFVHGDYSCGDQYAGASPGATVGNRELNLTPHQIDNAKIIIGVAKTLNLGEKGALIGLMTGITESRLRMYANTGIPISQENPAWKRIPQNQRGLGSDHDSVGVMQQRVSTGWSTFGNGPTKDITWQLMDTTYAAQAFFGVPDNIKLPDGLQQSGALRKGLQNKVPNFRDASVDPGVAAQTVQISAFPTRYNDHKEQAQSILDTYWESAPAVPVVISVTSGTPPAGTEDAACGNTITASGPLLQLVVKYALPDYHKAPYVDPYPSGKSELTKDTWPYKIKKEYYQAVVDAQARGDYVGGGQYPGVDCGGFVTLLMRNSGTDPNYNARKGNVVAQRAYLNDHPELYDKITTAKTVNDLKPGDIWINDDASHTYMFVGSINGFHGNSASASFSTTGQSWRVPMASNAGDIEGITWYRKKGGIPQ
jgi:hypothetical protein